MDNFLLAMSHHTSRRRNDGDNTDLIDKSTSRADTPSAPLSRVQTASNSPSRSRSPTPPKVRFDTLAKQVRTSDTDVSGASSQHNRSADVAIGGFGMVDASVSPVEREKLQRDGGGCTCKTRDGGAERSRDRVQNATVNDV